jgi:hypothetical protein
MAGAYASYFLNGSTGGCIVVLQVALFLGALFLAPRHGVVASHLKARAAATAKAPSFDKGFSQPSQEAL